MPPGQTAVGWASDHSTYLENWCAYLVSVRGRSPATAARYRALVERLLRDVGPLAKLSREAIEAHLRRLYVAGLGESVRQGVVVAVRSLGEWCLAHGHLESNPAAGLAGPRLYRREIRVLSVAEVSRLIWGNRAGTLPRDPRALRNRALLGVAYVAGLRASEIGPLEADGVAWNEATQTFSVLIRGAKAAGGDVRQPLDRSVSRLLGAYLAVRESGRYLWGRPLTRAAIRKVLHRRLAEEGIAAAGRRLSPHILRHSIATHLLAEGHDIRTVQLFMRHSSVATTEAYLHVDSERLGRALAGRSPLDRRRRTPQLQKGFQQLLGELQALARPE